MSLKDISNVPGHKTTPVECLLGLLSLGPLTGYQMRQLMQESTANFWRESFGRIYPALQQMQKAGLVEVEDPAPDSPRMKGPKARKVYRMTAAGEARLHAWLEVPPRRQGARNELLLKLFCGERAKPEVLRAEVKAWQQSYRDDLQRYEAKLAHLEATCAGEPGLPFWRITLRYGIDEAKMVVKWCAATLEELEKQATAR
jgi:DNA-binding PadR family transcriptional regulator